MIPKPEQPKKKRGGKKTTPTISEPKIEQILEWEEETLSEMIPNKEQRKDPIKYIRSLLRYNDDGRCTNVFKVATRIDILMLAYETIKSKPGNMVKGTSKETLDGITMGWFAQISKKIRSGRYQFQPARRVMIPKPNGKMRPLGIASPREKIIQQALRMVLETIMEPKFSDLSHGFRPKRGCHSALKEIRGWWGVPWVIEGDIKAFFDSIDQHMLCELLKRHVKEQVFINLY